MFRYEGQGNSDTEEVVVHLLHGQAVAGYGEHVGNERTVLLDCVVYGEARGHVLDDGAHADGKSTGRDLTVHDGVDKLLLASLGIFLHKGENLDILEAKLCNGGLHRLDSLGLVLLDCDDGLAAKDLLHDGGTDEDLLGALQHDTVVACQVGLALGSVQDQALGLAAGGGVQLHMCREGCSTESDDSVVLDTVQYEVSVLGNLCDKGLGRIDTLCPLFLGVYRYLDMGNRPSGQVLHRDYRLDGTGRGGMHEGGDESAGLGDDLSGLHLVAHCDHRLGGCSQVLGHGDAYNSGQGKDLYGAILCEL